MSERIRISQLIESMQAKGATLEVILVAIKAIEAQEDVIAEKRAKDAERKRKSRDKAVTVTGQSQDSHEIDEKIESHIENAGAPDSLILNLKKERKITGSRFSLTSLPPEWKIFCKEKRADLNPEETFDAFMDWWIAQPGSKGVKLDWFATWRTWVRNQKKPTGNFNAKPSEPRKSNVHTL